MSTPLANQAEKISSQPANLSANARRTNFDNSGPWSSSLVAVSIVVAATTSLIGLLRTRWDR
jgi:hypothetical protein